MMLGSAVAGICLARLHHGFDVHWLGAAAGLVGGLAFVAHERRAKKRGIGTGATPRLERA